MVIAVLAELTIFTSNHLVCASTLQGTFCLGRGQHNQCVVWVGHSQLCIGTAGAFLGTICNSSLSPRVARPCQATTHSCEQGFSFWKCLGEQHVIHQLPFVGPVVVSLHGFPIRYSHLARSIHLFTFGMVSRLR